MEVNFDRSSIFCLNPVLEEVRSSEQTQQIPLPDGMPDVGQVLCAWGQPILRGKEWRSDSLAASGGMMVWVLYAPEDGSEPRCIDGWIPFQLRWDLPEGIPEGTMGVSCAVRFTDARPVSARKILVRAGMAAMVTALAPDTVHIWQPAGDLGDVELKRTRYALRLMKEAGEKSFQQDEELTLPDTAPQPEKLIYSTIQPCLADRKVLSGKVVFRGNTRLHVLYRSEEGTLHSQDLEVPFSQYAELTNEHSTDAQAEFQLSPTSMETELDEEGHLRFKCGIAAQYIITDQQTVELVEDAYSPAHELDLEKRILEMPVVLENRRDAITWEQNLNWEGGRPVDIRTLPDYPRQVRTGQGIELQLPGMSQLLYYGEDGMLRACTGRWEGRQALFCDEHSQIRALPVSGEVQTMDSGGQFQLHGEQGLVLTAWTRQGMDPVTGITLGQERKKEPGRPSLILRRMGSGQLWDLAKESGSTLDAIRQANALTEDPVPGQMLLIPVP